ncbi:uncharacterized protein LOC143046657 [Mytilus galloprovincialis]|uniref:uncharacterized protein LOC143046657 n=1 Tax=Mytilus galloprovincialis TaxID=29158 RepID=UPI003F7CA893
MLFLLLIHIASLSRGSAQQNLTPFGTATQSSIVGAAGPKNAIEPPISTEWNFYLCTHTQYESTQAWWMFQFSYEAAYITDITIYYRQSFAYRMDGFKLYVTNTSTIPPDGYLCYEDPDPGLPNIIQTIPCNKLGKYVIYYDDKGSLQSSIRYDGPVVELCYVAIYGCQKSFWGSNCDKICPENCIEQHCHPTNGSCIWGCNPKNCLNDICDMHSGVCSDGCKEKNRTGKYCNKYDIASEGRVAQTPNGSEPASLANDGNLKSCSRTKGPTVTLQVDLKEESIVTGVYITFGERTTLEGNHTLYASNTSTSWKFGSILYKDTLLPTEISCYVVLRYLTYVPPTEGSFSDLEVCEIGIVGCPPSYYGPVCNQLCPENCHGPCDLDSGQCIFGCLDGWSGDKCEQACQAGLYGKGCVKTCSTNCLNPECHKVTGECFGRCKDGWQGFDCSEKCPSGQFGRNCSMLCDGCILEMCDPINGLCDTKTGCNPGYLNGEYCNTTCVVGFYGSDCQQVCSPLCLLQPCDRRTGECIGGCVHRLQGFNCTEVYANKEEVDSQVTTQIGLFSGGFLCCALIATIVCFTRQIRKKQEKQKTTTTTQRDEQQHYDDVRMENVSTYQDLRRDTDANEYDQISTANINH